MNSRALLSRLERIEVAAFGIDRKGRGEQWIERERRLLRLYFAMGVTGSGIVGAIGLLVLLAVAAGPGYDTWFGLRRKEDRARTVWDAPVAASPPIVSAVKSEPVHADGAVPAIARVAVQDEPVQPPFVRVISVVPVAQKAPAAAAKPVGKPVPKPQRVEAVAARPAPTVASDPPTEPAAVTDPQAIALVPASGIERPDGMINLGGPGRVTAEEPATWWRKLWWGTGGFAASQK